MRVGVLFSGGKDSVYALELAMQREDVRCLITLVSRNPESYMFHTPNIRMTELQAKALGIPHLVVETQGKEEEELKDLVQALDIAKRDHSFECVVTGAIESVYQARRVQNICHELGLWCYNPLWKKDQVDLLRELMDRDYSVLISGIFAYPLTESWLGKTLDHKMISTLVELNEKYRINPSGEGGELETTVLDAPFFRQKIIIDRSSISAKGNAGNFFIEGAHLEDKLSVGSATSGVAGESDLTGQSKRTSSCGQSRDVGGHEKIRLKTDLCDDYRKNILIVDMNARRDSLGYLEFVLPIERIVREHRKEHHHRDQWRCQESISIHLTELTPEIIQDADRIIMSGMPLKDHEHPEYVEKFVWMKNIDIPILGICGGMQFLAKLYGSEIFDCLEIGMTPIETVKDNPLFSSTFEAYELHSKAIEPSEIFEILARSRECVQAVKHKEKPQFGVQFHPEVRNNVIIERFLDL